MFVRQLIYNKTPKKKVSYYKKEQNDNTNDNQITNIDNSLELTKNTSDHNKKLTEQLSQEPVINEDINTPIDRQNKRSNYDILENYISSIATFANT